MGQPKGQLFLVSFPLEHRGSCSAFSFSLFHAKCLVCVCVPLFQDVRLRYKYHQTTVKKNLTTPSLRDFFRVQLQRNGPEGGHHRAE